MAQDHPSSACGAACRALRALAVLCPLSRVLQAPSYCWELHMMLNNSQSALSTLQEPPLSKVAAPSLRGSSRNSWGGGDCKRVTTGLAGWSLQWAGSGACSLPCPLCLLPSIPWGFVGSQGWAQQGCCSLAALPCAEGAPATSP